MVLFLAIFGVGCRFSNISDKAYLNSDYQKCDMYLDTIVGLQKIKVYSDSQRLYVFIRYQGKLWIDTIHYPISKDYDNLTKNICISGKYLTSCFVEGDMLFFTFTDFSLLKRLVVVNLNTHKVVAVKDGENMLGTFLRAFIFVNNRIICCHDPNLLDGKDMDLSVYKFTPDSIVYLGSRNIKIDVLKLFTDDSTMTSFLKATHDQMKNAPNKIVL